MNDSQYPWLILVPEIPNITEIFQLSDENQTQLMQESCFLAQWLSDVFKADKMNIAAIGNLVPQLHIHHVVRYKTDKSWPLPVWGKFPALPYSEQQLKQILQVLAHERIKPMV